MNELEGSSIALLEVRRKEGKESLKWTKGGNYIAKLKDFCRRTGWTGYCFYSVHLGGISTRSRSRGHVLKNESAETYELHQLDWWQWWCRYLATTLRISVPLSCPTMKHHRLSRMASFPNRGRSISVRRCCHLCVQILIHRNVYKWQRGALITQRLLLLLSFHADTQE